MKSDTLNYSFLNKIQLSNTVLQIDKRRKYCGGLLISSKL